MLNLTRSIAFFLAMVGLMNRGVSEDARAQQDSPVLFNRDVRPILSDNCYACHGPDANQRQAGLRLDLELDAKADLGGYAAIVPGDVANSEMLTRVFSDDDSEVMPPADHLKSLTDDEKQILKKWVEQGAQWQEHWAWIPPRETAPPAVSQTDWVRNYIDAYVVDELEFHNIQPSPDADPATLVRRLCFDLIGLPPTTEQLDAFLENPSREAYESLVDELLASPHFGEKMAIQWLDLVRYADSVGYHGDQEISVSPYRDYVIDAFNANMPFDQFTREQLAGDLLDKPTLEQRVASGFNRLGMMSAEGGVQPEEYLIKYAADRVRTTASVWLGITLGCAECHDHKFDPFSIEDFYSFSAFFADIKERGLYEGANKSGDWGPRIEVPDEELADLLAPLEAKIQRIQKSMTIPDAELESELAAWEASMQNASQWTPLRPLKVAMLESESFEILDDDSILMKGKAVNEDCYAVTVRLPKGQHSALRLEALPHDSLPNQGPGRAGNGNFVVTEMQVVRGDATENMHDFRRVINLWPYELKQHVAYLHNASATFEQTQSAGANPYKKWSAESAVDRDRQGQTFGWAVMPEGGKANELVANFMEPVDSADTELITVVIQQFHGSGNHVLGRFRISSTDRENAIADPMRSLPQEIKDVLAVSRSERTAEQRQALVDYYLPIAPRFERQRFQLELVQNQRKELIEEHTRTSLITERTTPREIRVLPRGNWMDKSGEVVAPQFPAVFAESESATASSSGNLTRLDLANWIVDPQNALTSRTFVNRLWARFFGKGLSGILDDVGSQGEWPSHPELLDALALDFVESGWDIKHMVRTIVTSHAYQQSSVSRPELESVDPYNRLLARQSRYRLDAELIRDNALAVSGLLIPEIGGRSAKPYQPPGFYRNLHFPKRTYQPDVDENQFRRGVYTHWQRQFLHPAMMAFDAPAREECTCERPRSNTPTGALVLLNDPSYVEAARNLASLTMDEVDGTAEERLRFMFRRAISRLPNDRETEVLLSLYQSHLEHFQTAPRESRQLISVGISPVRNDLPTAELAAWTSVARAIMNMHEFVTRN